MADNMQSRFEDVSRRAFLKRSATLGATVLVPGWLIAACAGESESFVSTTSTMGAAGSDSVDSTTSSTETTTTTLDEASSTTVPSSAEMLVHFTYSASSSQGPVKNPYVAVWLEDSEGELAATVALWFLQSQKGTKWLSDLRRWYSVDGSQQTVDTISSATRTPGDYTVAWDGAGFDGSRVPEGDYYICIEAAREHGPYSLVRESITLANSSFDLRLPDDGELTDVAVSYVV